jgi:4'-phosphopantetheinyl transferase
MNSNWYKSNISSLHVHLWVIDLEHISKMDRLVLSKEEKERADRFIVVEPQRNYMACRAALRLVLSHYLRITPESICFTYNDSGKPFIDSSLNKQLLQFNLSHNDTVCCIAVTAAQNVGVDIENLLGPPLEDAMDIFLSKKEVLSLSNNNKDRLVSLYHLWTQKEALLKAKGTGFQTDPKQVHGYVTPWVNLINKPFEGYILNSFMMGTNIVSLCTENEINYEIIPFASLEDQKK